MVTTRGQRCDEAWLKPRNFVSRQRFVVSRQDFTELCHDRVLCRDKVWPRPKVLVLRHNMLCCDRVGQGQEFLYHDRVFLCRDRVWPWAGFFCRDIIFYVAVEFGQMRRFCVATWNFRLRHCWPGWEDFLSRLSVFMSRQS